MINLIPIVLKFEGQLHRFIEELSVSHLHDLSKQSYDNHCDVHHDFMLFFSFSCDAFQILQRMAQSPKLLVGKLWGEFMRVVGMAPN